MFDIDASKLLIIGVFALVFLGPKELPRVMRQVGNAIGKMRRMAADFQGQFMDAMRESELDDIRKEVAKVGDAAKVELPSIEMPNLELAKIDPPTLDPQAEIRKAIEAGGAPAAPDAAAPALPDAAPAAPESAGEEITFRTPPPEPAPEPVAAEGPRRRSARPQGA
ncbi:MAG: twin-arginine translocase subunit TatB [Methylobacteriaceae bacterium]|nr:twin-arginine translocase subunit TatB [Methylobacteriaceae bacterium]